MEEMGRSLGEGELHLATFDPEVHRQLLQCMLAEAVDEGKHWFLENDLPSPDREQNHSKDLMQIKPWLSIKDHLITKFPNAPKNGSSAFCSQPKI
jgi:hypothetical protein